MRDLINLVEGLLGVESPADRVIKEVYQNLDDTWGSMVLDSFESKSSHPEHFNWPLETSDRLIILEQIEAARPKRGYGKKMMQVLCDTCDRHGVTIFLDANAFGRGLGQRGLVAFYQSFDFEFYPEMEEHTNYPMIRDPQ